jgi:hypothetical protein
MAPAVVALSALLACASCADDSERALEGGGSQTADAGADAPIDAEFDGTDVGVDVREDVGGADTGDTSPADTGAGDTGHLADSGPDTGDDADPTTLAPEVDPTCIDGQYTEALPDPTVDISADINAYQSGNPHDFIDNILTKRWPVGAWIVQQALTNPQMDCVDVFTSDTTSPGPVLGRLSVVVHECGHLFNLTTGGYQVTPALTLSCGGGGTFHRSELLNDSWQQERPPCPNGFPTGSCDHYADTYLEGNSGAQGFGMLFEEMHQYVNSLATGYAIHDYMSNSRSEMDGILTFMWYLERYLHMARVDYPQTYSTLVDDPCWREAILTMWGRAWLMLSAAEGIDTLGISEEALFELVRTPELLAEIQRVRDAQGCN